MLKAVDGKVSVAELVVQFADADADAADLLAQLDRDGLIKLREDRAIDFQSFAALPTPDFAATDKGLLELVATSQAASTSLAPTIEAPTPNTGLDLIVDVMSTFVLTHIPEQAFSVLGKLETVRSLNELQAELPTYSALATACGPAGLVHLAELTERVREAAAAAA